MQHKVKLTVIDKKLYPKDVGIVLRLAITLNLYAHASPDVVKAEMVRLKA